MTRLLAGAVLVALVAIAVYASSGSIGLGGLLGPGSSGEARSAPVPFAWSTHISHREDGHRLRLQSKSPVAADEVRLLAPDGSVVASATAKPVDEKGWNVCDVPVQAGAVLAEVPLSRSEVGRLQPNWPSGYRVEVRAGGTWRPVQLTFAGCSSIE